MDWLGKAGHPPCSCTCVNKRMHSLACTLMHMCKWQHGACTGGVRSCKRRCSACLGTLALMQMHKWQHSAHTGVLKHAHRCKWAVREWGGRSVSAAWSSSGHGPVPGYGLGIEALCFRPWVFFHYLHPGFLLCLLKTSVTQYSAPSANSLYASPVLLSSSFPS